MNEQTKTWVLILMMIGIPIVILTTFFLISGISIKEMPLWTTIGVPIIIIGSTFIFLLIQPKAQSLSLQKRRKALLIILGVYIIFLIIMTIIRGISFLGLTNIGSLIGYFFLITIFLYGFFRKDKESTEDNNQNHSEN